LEARAPEVYAYVTGKMSPWGNLLTGEDPLRGRHLPLSFHRGRLLWGRFYGQRLHVLRGMRSKSIWSQTSVAVSGERVAVI